LLENSLHRCISKQTARDFAGRGNGGVVLRDDQETANRVVTVLKQK